jgi:hypothetical protein
VPLKGSDELRASSAHQGIALPVFLMRIESLVDSSAFVCCDRRGVIVAARNCAPLLGYRDEELVGRPVRDAFSDAVASRVF